MSDTNASLPPLTGDAQADYFEGLFYAALEVRERQLLDALRRLAEVEGNNRWIPCNERMPEHEQHVLTIDARGEVEVDWLDIYRHDGPEWDADKSNEPTHWRPLPPAPTEFL
jgi:hypothetical protein